MALYVAMFLLTLSGLMFEIGLTRIFSATIWYHFAFVAISVALLGWGLGGFAVHLLRARFAPSVERSGALALAYGLSLPLTLWLIVRFPFHPDRLAFYFVASLTPFLLAGSAISMLFALAREKTGRLYFADLLGASVGALAVTFLLSALGGETAVLSVAIAPLAAAALLSRRMLWPSLVGAVLLVAAVGMNERTGLFKIRSAPTKGLYQQLASTPGTRITMTGWNAYSRIDVVEGFPDPYLARLYIDSDAWTSVLQWDGRLDNKEWLRSWYRALPFEIAPPKPKTLVIGPGGGSDVLVALAAGSSEVTAVEMNPLMFRFVRHFGAEAGNLYDQPKVRAVLSEGRTFVRRTQEKFDVILLGFVDSWASVASGGLSLAENHLYTTEAFEAYYDHLTDDGILVILRWDVDVPRLVTNSVALLGAPEAAKRVAVVFEKRGTDADPPQMIFMLRKRPFTPDETASMVDRWQEARPYIVPGRHTEPPFDGLLSGTQSLAQFVAAHPDRVDPVYDDRPFFFARQKPWGLPNSMRNAFGLILTPLVLLCAALLVLGRPKEGSTRPYAGSVVYFAALGISFIAVELALLQHLTLLLGHPIFTLSILLFTLLAAGGLGSWASPRFAPGRVCLVVAALGLVYALALPFLVPALLPLSLVARIAIAVALVAPLGFAMGMPFPRGLTSVGHGPFPAAPFYWGLNGIFSVIGSVGTMVVAVIFGFTVAMIAGSLGYLVAALAARSLAVERAS